MKQIARTRSNEAEAPSVAHAPAGETQLQPTISPEIQSLLGKRPLMTGEDPSAYDDLLTQVSLSVKPADAIEWLWVKDVVDLVCDIQRLRRVKSGILSEARREALQSLVSAHHTPSKIWPTTRDLVQDYIAGEARARKEVDELIRNRDQQVDEAVSKDIQYRLKTLERIEYMIASAESRRDKILREMETRRSSMARRLREASQQVIDVKEVP